MSVINKIKYNGQEYDLYGLGGDVLPVGSEMDITSDTQIPAGWEEVEDYDTGWVTLELAPNVAVRRGGSAGEDYTPKIRRIGNIVITTGCIDVSALQSNSNSQVFINIPNGFIPIDYNVRLFSTSVYTLLTDNNSIYFYKSGNGVTKVDVNGMWLLNENTKRIRKVSETQAPSIGEVYDDQERVVGTWFGKPLYQKTLYYDKTQYSIGSTTLNHNIENVEMIMFKDAILYRDYDKTFQMIADVDSNMANWGIGIRNMTATSFNLWLGDMNDMSQLLMYDYMYITFRYTKTTN